MSDYDGIRPYTDGEVPEVLERLLNNPSLPQAASALLMPKLLQHTALGSWLAARWLRSRTRNVRTVRDCQVLVAEYFERLIDQTIEDLSVAGLERLSPDQAYLFVSNHRDIVMDSSLISYQLFRAGHQTCRMAVGNNLFINPLASDLMRLNKSFMVERDVSGPKALLKTLNRTSSYIRHSLEEGQSVWIAQREGRSKDGFDRTEPALAKMLGLAYRTTRTDAVRRMTEAVKLVPVSISYELDPCALRKAHELYVVATEGHYAKAVEEDVQSIVTGVMGYKGRVHLEFSPPIDDVFDRAEALAQRIDEDIVGGLRVFPTHLDAAEQVGLAVDPARQPTCDASSQFRRQVQQVPELERPHLLWQYANIIRNRRELGFA